MGRGRRMGLKVLTRVEVGVPVKVRIKLDMIPMLHLSARSLSGGSGMLVAWWMPVWRCQTSWRASLLKGQVNFFEPVPARRWMVQLEVVALLLPGVVCGCGQGGGSGLIGGEFLVC